LSLPSSSPPFNSPLNAPRLRLPSAAPVLAFPLKAPRLSLPSAAPALALPLKAPILPSPLVGSVSADQLRAPALDRCRNAASAPLAVGGIGSGLPFPSPLRLRPNGSGNCGVILPPAA